MLASVSVQVPLRCRCGSVQGVAIDVSPESGNRLVCLCDDCQAYARWLERDDILDADGGTDIFHMTPSQLRIASGGELLRCMRLSERGMLRWFTACCRTPIANTLASARIPLAGVVHCFMDHAADGRTRNQVLGPPFASIHGRDARHGLPPHAHPRIPLRMTVRILRLFARAWLGRRHQPSPFFDPATARPIAQPQVLTKAERDRLRPLRASSP